MIEFICPSCDAELEAADSRAGAKVKCPECGERFLIPSKGKRGPSRERAPEERPRQASAARGSRRKGSGQGRRESSGSNTGILIACAGGAAVLLLAVVVGIAMLLRSPKDDARVENPRIVPQQQVVNRQQQDSVNKPENRPAPDVKNQEATTVSDTATLGGDDSGQVIYKHLLKSAVWILVLQPEGISAGTGTLVDRKNRLVLTNHHVVDGGQAIVVFFPTYKDGKLVAERDFFMQQFKQQDVNHAHVLAKEQKRDLALIQIDRVPEGIEALTLAKNSTSPGMPVHSMGNPGSSGALWIYTSGTVRQVYHKTWATGPETMHEAQVVETQSPTNRGDSGGPLVNGRGELVGVTHGGLASAQLVSLFIDVGEATDFITRTCLASGLSWERETRAIIAGNAAGVPGLIRNLESADGKVRGNAAQALGNAGVEARLAVGSLLKLLGSESDPLTRRLAVEALNKIGPPEKTEIGVLIVSLRDDHPEVRSFAAFALGKLGADARSALPDLLKTAKDRDAGVRQHAIRALGYFGAEGKEAILQNLADAFKDSDRDVRIAAGEALTNLNVLGAAELPMLQETLKHQDAEVRAAAARALGQLGRTAKPATAALIAAFRSSDRGVRKSAAEALANIGGAAKELVPVFADVLTDPDKNLCKTATSALAKFGAEAKDAAPALASVLADTDKGLRKTAATTLGKIGPEAKSAVPALAEALKEDDDDFRMEVLGALAAIGPDAKAAVPALIQVFESRSKPIHRKCALTLGKIGKDAVKPLITALNHENFLIRIGAAMSLGEIGPAAKIARYQLTRHAQEDLDSQVRLVASSALVKVMAKP